MFNYQLTGYAYTKRYHYSQKLYKTTIIYSMTDLPS